MERNTLLHSLTCGMRNKVNTEYISERIILSFRRIHVAIRERLKSPINVCGCLFRKSCLDFAFQEQQRKSSEGIVVSRTQAARHNAPHCILKRGDVIEWQKLWCISYVGPSSGPEEVCPLCCCNKANLSINSVVTQYLS